MFRTIIAVMIAIMALLWISGHIPVGKMDQETPSTPAEQPAEQQPPTEPTSPTQPSPPTEPTQVQTPSEQIAPKTPAEPETPPSVPPQPVQTPSTQVTPPTPQTPSSNVARVEKGNLVIEDIPEIPRSVTERMNQYQNTRSAALQGWGPGGAGLVITTRFAETAQLHYVAEPGGARRQLTFFNEPINQSAVNPDLNKHEMLFTKDVGGGEFYQIFSFHFDTGEYKMLTDGSSRNGSILWSRKGDEFAYYSTKRDGADWDIYISSTEKPENARMILEANGAWEPLDWSPDDQKMLVLNYISANESYLDVLDLVANTITPVNYSDQTISYGSAFWSSDGKGIYFTSDENGEFQHLRYYDLAMGTQMDLTGDITWDVSEFALSPDGKSLSFVANEDGISKLYLYNIADAAYEPVKNLPIGQIYTLTFSPSSEELAMVINTPQTPGDVYTLNLSDQSLTRWTFSEVGGLNTEKFISPTLIHYPTFDKARKEQREIPAFYYKPRGDGPFPVLIYIHGGPESQFVPTFIATFQYYLNEMGIAVIAPNVRGSSGYGKSYLKLDNGNLREDSVKDIGALLDWIAQQPDLDASRVAVIGGSYGGYMVLACMTHYSDRLKAGIEQVGISNFVTFLESTEDYRKDLRRAEYGDERDPEMRKFLEEISPANHADLITKPMFIAQGLNDPRVPVHESEQMVAAIRTHGGEVWYVMAKDEGHGFVKKANRDYYSNAVVLFMEKYLLDSAGNH